MNEMTNGFIFLMNVLDDGTVQFLAKSNSFLSAGNMVREAAVLSDGKGGGSDTFAQGGGKTVDSFDSIVETIERIIKAHE